MEEVIALLKTTRPTFYRWLRAGKLKGTKVGRQWRFLRQDVERFLRGQEPEIDLPADITPLLEQLSRRLAREEKDSSSNERSQDELTRLPEAKSELAQVVELMIRLAARMHASDLHLMPQPGGTAALQFRLDGQLQPIAGFDLRLLPPLIRHWKTLTGCSIQETMRPQDGRMMYRLRGASTELDLRATFLPAILGETVTVRLLDPNNALIHLEEIHYAEEDKPKLRHWLESPAGLIVVTGPAGSGKTSALYACLNYVMATSPSRKVITIEDPVEYVLPGTIQLPVRAEANLGFAGLLRASLKAAPDVIMLGEIRDLETLTLALQTALNGHLVLITLHAGAAVAALQRMVDVGANTLMVGEATKLIVAQRLVRLLCPECAQPAELVGEDLATARQLATEAGLNLESLPSAYRKPVGCAVCHQTGYKGRNVVAEALEMSPALCAELNRRAGILQLQAAASRDKMTSMLAHGLRLAAEGKTSLAEVLKTVGPSRNPPKASLAREPMPSGGS